jgi:hypothetical protein
MSGTIATNSSCDRAEIDRLKTKYAAEIRSLTDWTEALDTQLKFTKEQLIETNKNWTDTITYYEKRIETYRAWLIEQGKKYSIYLNVQDAKVKYLEIFGVE